MEHFSASLQHKLDEIYIRNEKANIGLKFLHGEIPVTLQRLTSKSAASIRNLKEIRKKGKNLTFLGGSEWVGYTNLHAAPAPARKNIIAN